MPTSTGPTTPTHLRRTHHHGDVVRKRVNSVIVFLLIVIAAGLTLAAHFTETFYYGIAAVAVALISVTLVAARSWADRRAPEQDPTPAHAADQKEDILEKPALDDDSDAAFARNETADGADSPESKREAVGADETAVPIGVAEADVEIVRIIPGRKRFHEPGCSSLIGRQSEELTREEAAEEGFTPCSMCSEDKKTITKVG